MLKNSACANRLELFNPADSRVANLEAREAMRNLVFAFRCSCTEASPECTVKPDSRPKTFSRT
jgi:hypothetical protein